MRNVLHDWIQKPGGEEVLVSLASWAPKSSEVPFFTQGLQVPDLQTAAKCITALHAVDAKEAMPAILAVFDRTDALNDLHPRHRDSTRQMRFAMAVPPADRDNLAYMADEALFHLAGGEEAGLEPVPPYTGKQVLDQRKAYWKTWLESQQAESHDAK